MDSIEKEIFPLNGQQERTKSIIHQQITIKFKAGAQDAVIKRLKWLTFTVLFRKLLSIGLVQQHEDK